MENISKEAKKAALLAEIAAKGLDAEKLASNVAISYLPASGKFLDCVVTGETVDGINYAHLEMTTTGGGHIAIKALSAQFADNADTACIQNSKGKYYLPSTVHCPQFTGDLIELGLDLIDKPFVTKRVNGFVSKFSTEGYDTAESVVIVPKTFYITTLV